MACLNHVDVTFHQVVTEWTYRMPRTVSRSWGTCCVFSRCYDTCTRQNAPTFLYVLNPCDLEAFFLVVSKVT